MVIGYKSEKDTLPSTWTQLLVDSLGHDPPSSHAQRPWGGGWMVSCQPVTLPCPSTQAPGLPEVTM